MSTIILQRFANREYRLTHQDVFAGKRKGGDKYTEKQAEKYAIAARDTYVLQQELRQGEAALISDGRLERRSFGEVDARLGIRALDIINEFQQRSLKVKNKGGWGFQPKPTVFGKNARHRLLEAGAVMDKMCGRNVCEVTCTIPGSGREVFKTVANWSGWIMNRLTQLVRRSEKATGWFYVWELQKRGALHLHFAIGSSTLSDAVSLAQELEFMWFELLLELKDKTGVDVFRKTPNWTWRNSPQEWKSHCLPVYKSVAAYFSKYCSKQSKASGKSAKYYSPARFWGSNKSIKDGIKAGRKKWKFEGSKKTCTEISEFLQGWLSDREKIKQYSYEFQLGKTKAGTELGGGGVQVNFYSDTGFARLQQWEEVMWQSVLDIAKDGGEYEDPTQTWTDADMGFLSPLYADMDKRRHHLSNADMQTYTPSPSPHSQQSSNRSKLSKSSGTQPKATLELRALLIQFLASGDGVTGTVPLLQAPLALEPSQWLQPLLCKETFRSWDYDL
jgi:hypothetical protein